MSDCKCEMTCRQADDDGREWWECTRCHAKFMPYSGFDDLNEEVLHLRKQRIHLQERGTEQLNELRVLRPGLPVLSVVVKGWREEFSNPEEFHEALDKALWEVHGNYLDNWEAASKE